MPSQVEICRLGLAHIADAARVNSIDPPDSTIQASHCATFYPIARDEILESADWYFAKKRAELATSLYALENDEWAFAYELPSDFLRAIKVVPPGTQRDYPGQAFLLETSEDGADRILYTNVEEAWLHYVFRQEATGLYTPLFVSALSYLLGSYVAGPILKGKVGAQLKKSLYEMYELYQAKAVASLENGQKTTDSYADYKPQWVTDR